MVAERTGLDIKGMKAGLNGLEQKLRSRVFGQDNAAAEVAAALNRSAAGLTDPEKPAASFCFIGSPGTGRETLAVRLAESVFNNSVIRLNGGELADEGAVYRLIGAPVGYRDSDKGGSLTEYVKLHPFSVVIVRECRACSAEVASILGRIVSEGVIEDGRGHAVSFRNCVMVFIADIEKRQRLGFDHSDVAASANAESDAMRVLPECIASGLDSVVAFSDHTRESILMIVRSELMKTAERAAKRGISLEFEPEAEAAVADACGLYANSVRHIVSVGVEDALSRALLSGAVASGDRAVCGRHDGRYFVERR